MADLHLRQTIELFVDQQVFMDVVHGNEQIEEFSALTEVTSFEQRGENLYLEGNILFTAYLKQAKAAVQDDHEVAPGSTSEETVEHISHRMPFDVTVPVDAQIAGMLSVAVTVPDTTVDVLGPGWIHIRALVQIEGLSPEGGYVAHCGAQEAIVPALPNVETDTSPAADADQDAWNAYAQQFTQQQSAADDSLAQTQTADQTPSVSSVDSADAAPKPSSVTKPLALEDLLQPLGQRQGDVPDAPFSPGKHFGQASAKAAQTEPESSLSEDGWKTQLAGADRALFGTFSPYRTGRAQDEESAQKSSAEQTPDTGGTAADASHHFHFESVDLGADPPPATGASDHVEKLKAEFESARSEWQDAVLQPAPEPAMPIPLTPPQAQPVVDVHLDVQKVNVHKEELAEAAVPVSSVSVDESKKAGEVTMSYTAVPETDKKEWTAAQWFWNTLNIPSGENAYTMRFRIVQEAETLDEIASHYATSAADLLRVNPLLEGGLQAGALLYIPTRP